jgi:hypothetical protein
MNITIPISVGEFLDKIAIDQGAEIKRKINEETNSIYKEIKIY